MDNQQNTTGEHKELCSMLCGSLDGKGVGGEWTHLYVRLSPFNAHLKLSQYSAIPQHKMLLVVKKRKCGACACARACTHTCVRAEEYYSAVKRNETGSFVEM